MPSVRIGDYGMLNGLAEGLKQGLITYQNTKNIQHTQALQNLVAGVQENPQTGLLEYTPEKQQQLALQKQQDQRSIDAMNPNSDISHQGVARRIGLLNAVHPGTDYSFLNGASEADLEKFDQLIKPDISGYYGMMGQKQRADAMGGLITTKNNQLADQISKDFGNNPVIKKWQDRKGQVDVDLHTINDPKAVMTPQLQTELEAGFANAISGGQGSSEGTRNKVEYDNYLKKLAGLKGKFGSKPVDTNDPEYRQLLKESFERLKESYDRVIYHQARLLQQQKTGIFKGNPQADAAVKQGAEAYNPDNSLNAAPPAPPPTNEVERVTKDGKVGIFDANTKKFLRWK